MWLKWLPWRYLVSRLARRQGFVDPIALLARMHRFAQPSEVALPLELLRAGMVFHARGLINSRAIQHNLDWVWPFWVERQFDPRDPAFVPRAFSLTHINLTHRNWTAVGLPDCDWLPIVDPRGLVTPLFDGWSLDFWLLPANAPPLLPSRADVCEQRLLLGDRLAVRTVVGERSPRIESLVEVVNSDGPLRCRVKLRGRCDRAGWLVVAVRPVNPEGISFVHRIRRTGDRSLRINDQADVIFDRPPDRVLMSDYHCGDVLLGLPDVGRPIEQITCPVGLATAAALFPLPAGQDVSLKAAVPLARVPSAGSGGREASAAVCARPGDWTDAQPNRCNVRTPDAWFNFLFDAAAANLVLHAPDLVYPGPYTYKRFWFRDASFILDALLAIGQIGRAGRTIAQFPDRQTRRGYFHSQEGEWDSNGQVLWILERFRRAGNQPLPPPLQRAVVRGARWIIRKRLSDTLDRPHAGLMPAGFSAEHLGPNDYYYWDDFWSIAGLYSAARLCDDPRLAEDFRREAGALSDAVDRSIATTTAARDRRGVPASPYRRMDAGAIGSLACGYPLRLWPADDPRLLATVEFLLRNCCVRDGFFQDMIHSGINAYLTLHIAQVLLRAGDPRFFPLVESVARLASPTGQWPEAIHPQTLGGCMGDGQHIWAAAEWVLMLRNMFVREEDGRLILGSGLPIQWLTPGATLGLGPTLTMHGPITVNVQPSADGATVAWSADWPGPPPRVEVRLPGHAPADCPGSQTSVAVVRTAGPPAS